MSVGRVDAEDGWHIVEQTFHLSVLVEVGHQSDRAAVIVVLIGGWGSGGLGQSGLVCPV